MYTLVNLDNNCFLIVKKEDLEGRKFSQGTDLPIKIYGFLHKQLFKNKDEVAYTIVTNEKLTPEQEENLYIEALDESKPVFKFAKKKV